MMEGGDFFSFKDIFAKGGKIDATGRVLTIQYPSWNYYNAKEFFISFTTGFYLDETLMKGLMTMAKGEIRSEPDFSSPS